MKKKPILPNWRVNITYANGYILTLHTQGRFWTDAAIWAVDQVENIYLETVGITIKEV